MTLKLGDSSDSVFQLQYDLRNLGFIISIDGNFGNKTKAVVISFQKQNNLYPDGIAGKNTMQAIRIKTNLQKKGFNIVGGEFAFFVDTGHGGRLDNGKYITAGKRAYHEGLALHQEGHYYEGFENRIIGEMLIQELSKIRINTIRTYHPYLDWPLSYRKEIIKAWLRRGYYGGGISLHSNAISSDDPKRLGNTRGALVFTSRGEDFSDVLAAKHYDHLKAEFANDWTVRRRRLEKDYEADFAIIDGYTEEFPNFGIILEEFGFHTSSWDAEFITQPETRKRRVACAVKTAIWAKENRRPN